MLVGLDGLMCMDVDNSEKRIDVNQITPSNDFMENYNLQKCFNLVSKIGDIEKVENNSQ
jgi:hypothetical protein